MVCLVSPVTPKIGQGHQNSSLLVNVPSSTEHHYSGTICTTLSNTLFHSIISSLLVNVHSSIQHHYSGTICTTLSNTLFHSIISSLLVNVYSSIQYLEQSALLSPTLFSIASFKSTFKSHLSPSACWTDFCVPYLCACVHALRCTRRECVRVLEVMRKTMDEVF